MAGWTHSLKQKDLARWNGVLQADKFIDPNITTLTDDSMADALHRHSELSASDGSPNPALSVDATGDVTIGTGSSGNKLNVGGGIGATSNIDLNGATNAFVILDRNTTSNFAAFQFKTNGTTAATVGLYNTGQDDLYIKLDGADGTRQHMILFDKNNATIFNNSEGDHDHQFKGDGDANLLFLDAGTDKVGIGTATPGEKLHIVGNIQIGSTVLTEQNVIDLLALLS